MCRRYYSIQGNERVRSYPSPYSAPFTLTCAVFLESSGMAIHSRQSSQGHNTRRISNDLPCAAANYEIAADMQIEFAIKVVPLQLVVIRFRVR